MYTLWRKENQKVIIDNRWSLWVSKIKSQTVSLCFDFPDDVAIGRGEADDVVPPVENNIRESKIEAYLRRMCHDRKYLSLKLVPLGLVGFPDRTILMPGGRVAFVEVKRKGGKLSAMQQRWLNTLNDMGFIALVVWSHEDIDELFEVILR